MGTTALATNRANHTINMWYCENQLKQIREIVSPSAPLTDVEFSCLVELGRATQLNPFQREIWAVKYKQNAPANIFIGRDGYSNLAKRDREYECHQVEAVYSKDNFKIVNGEILHTLDPINVRGDLIGAYCKVKRKSSEKPTYVWVTMDEYNLKQGIWNSKPATMIKKVAEAQALRQAFHGLAGTYSDAEDFTEKPRLHVVNTLEGSTQTERLKSLINSRDVVDPIPTQELCTNTKIDDILELLEVCALPEDRFHKALDNYRVTDIADLSEDQADDFITNLRKIYDKQSLTSG